MSRTRTGSKGGRRMTSEERAAARHARMVEKMGPELVAYWAGSASESYLRSVEEGREVVIVVGVQ